MEFEVSGAAARHVKLCMTKEERKKHPKPLRVPVMDEISSADGQSDPLDEQVGSFGFLFDREHGLLICRACAFCVSGNASSVKRHLQSFHRVSVDTVTLTSLLSRLELRADSELESFLRPTARPVPRVNGLKIVNGFSCQLCVYFCETKRNMTSHIKNQHQQEAPEGDSFRECELQSLYQGPFKCYFSVQKTISASSIDIGSSQMGDNMCQDLHNHLEESTRRVRESVAPDTRLASPFMQQVMWISTFAEHVSGGASDIASAVKFSELEDDPRIHSAVSIYFEFGQRLIPKTELLHRRYILSEHDDIKDTPNGFTGINEASGRYCLLMTRLIFMVFRCVSDNASPKIFVDCPIDQDLKRAVSSLFEICRCGTENPTKLLVAVHCVLASLFLVDSSYDFNVGAFKRYPVYRFVVCASVKDSSSDTIQFRKTGQITSIAASFVYWGRLHALMTVYDKSWNKASTTPPSRDRLQGVVRFLKDGTETPFNSLLEIIRIGSFNDSSGEGIRPIVWTSDDFSSMVCFGTPFSVVKLRETASKLVNEMKRTLFHELMLGFKTDAIREEFERHNFVDDLDNPKPNYWFMTDVRNRFSQNKDDLLRHFTSGEIGRRFVCGLTTVDNPVFDKKYVRSWLQKCDKFTRLLVSVVHLTCGQPARGTELTTFRIRNSATELRSVFMIRNRIAFLQMYHKSMSMTGKFKPIVRFAPDCINWSILLYLTMVRPIQSLFFKAVEVDVRPDQLQWEDLLFYTNGAAMSGQNVRDAVHKTFLKIGGIDLTISQYRHAAIALMDKHVGGYSTVLSSCMNETSETLFHEQAGHQPSIGASIYSRSNLDSSRIDKERVHKFFLCSTAWHRFLQLPGEMLSNQTFDPSINQEAQSNLDLVAAIRKEYSGMRVDFVSQLQSMRQELHEFQQDFRLVMAASNAARNSPPVTAVRRPAVDARDMILAHRALILYRKNENAEFMSDEQALALGIILGCPQQLLVVLPTGGGKSLLYIGAALLSPGVATSIVVVPMVALLDESLEKCKALSLSCAKFTSSNESLKDHYDIIFVAVEQIHLEDFQTLMVVLNEINKLRSIFFDEAHLVITAAGYRPQMKSTSVLLQYGVPIILLTASLPPSLETDLKSATGVEFHTVRASTSRPNITYQVTSTTDIDVTVLEVMVKYEKIYQGSKDRCILFCLTKGTVSHMKKQYQEWSGKEPSCYFGNMAPDDRNAAVLQWHSGSSVWMIATCAFGVGIDYPSVRVVAHYGGARSMIDYVQETGRAGRDNTAATAITFTSRQFQEQFLNTHAKESNNDLRQHFKYLKCVSRCRRQQIAGYVDGDEKLPCVSSKHVERCDFCTKIASNFLFDPKKRQRTDLNVAAAAAVSSTQLRAEKEAVLTVRGFFDQLESPVCSVCWIRGKNAIERKHDLQQCVISQQKCLSCQDTSHHAGKCSLRLHFSQGVCFGCGIPSNRTFGQNPFRHGNELANKCSHPARDFGIPAVWAYFRAAERTFDYHHLPRDAMSFAEWLPLIPGSGTHSNYILLLAFLIENYFI